MRLQVRFATGNHEAEVITGGSHEVTYNLEDDCRVASALMQALRPHWDTIETSIDERPYHPRLVARMLTCYRHQQSPCRYHHCHEPHCDFCPAQPDRVVTQAIAEVRADLDQL